MAIADCICRFTSQRLRQYEFPGMLRFPEVRPMFSTESAKTAG
jgi:hypothetical protein